MKVKAVFEPAEECGFTAYVPSLPGCISEGLRKRLKILSGQWSFISERMIEMLIGLIGRP